MTLKTLLDPLLQTFIVNWHYFAIVAGLAVIAKVLSNPVFKGWLGERRVRKTLDSLDPGIFRAHHDLYVPRHDSEDLTQIDHVIVSPYGVFVIETKNYKGWIFGSEKQCTWTQQNYRSKQKFQNPLHQNNLHINSLAAYLDLPKNRFHSLVVFVGQSTFKTPMPDNVISKGLNGWILAHSTLSLTPPELESVRARLVDLDQHTDRNAASRTHRKNLRSRRA